MSLRTTMRAFTRATSTMLATAALALVPATAHAAGLPAATQLAAMNSAIKAAPAFFAGHTTGCSAVTPMLATEGGQIMAGNFRDEDGNCYVWLNLQQSAYLTGPEICKTTLHEMGHLNGFAHSQDPQNVMASPFRADPMPAPCSPQPVAAFKLCPPGATNQDYCQAAAALKKKAPASKQPARRPKKH